MSGSVLSNKTSKWVVVFCAFSIVALCGSNVVNAPFADTQTIATTGLEDVFSDVETAALTIKNISFETNDKDEYYLKWIFDNGNNDDIESTIDVHVKTDGPMYFFRHLKHVRKSDFYKIDIGKLDKCRKYNATLQAHNKLGDSEKYHFNFETSTGPVKNIDVSSTGRSISVSWEAPDDDPPCATEYEVKISIIDYDDVVLPADVLNYEYTELFACTEYTITVTALPNDGTVTPESGKATTDGPTELRPVDGVNFNDDDVNELVVTWTPVEAEKACIMQYNITVDGTEVAPVPQGQLPTHTIPAPGTCQRYEVSVVAVPHDTGVTESSKPTPGEYITKGGAVIDPTTEPTSQSSIKISWKPPVSGDCVTGYVLTLNGGNEHTALATEFSHEYTGLLSCTEYDITVVAKSDEGPGPGPSPPLKEKTLSPTELRPVDGVNFNDDDVNELVVTWTPVEAEKACIMQYNITVDGTEVAPVPQGQLPTHTIPAPGTCQRYEVSVVAVPHDTGTTGSSKPTTEEYTTKGEAHSKPKIVPDVSDPRLDRIKFNITTDSTTETACELTNVHIKCDAKDEDNEPDLTWIVKTMENTFDVQNTVNPNRMYVLGLTGLSLFTNYTCTAESYVGTEASGRSDEIQTNTKKISIIPTNIRVVPTSNTVKIEWDSEFSLADDQTKYSIEITPIKANHHIPEGCTDPGGTPRTEESNKLIHAFASLAPSYTYMVAIKSISWLGTSEPQEKDGVLTLTAESEAVRELKEVITENEVTADKYDVTADISWKYPCNTNGPVTMFKITITETSQKSKAISTYDEIHIPIGVPQELYNHVHPLKPYCNYNVKIETIGEQTTSASGDIDFESPQGYPAAPINLEVTDDTGINFKIKWAPPTEPNGVLTGYQVQIYDTPGYFIPKGCVLVTNDLTELLGESALEFPYTKAQAYHVYTIEVSAKTGTFPGYGKAISLNHTTTPASKPGPIRALAVVEIVSNVSEEFENKMEVKIDPPCDIAGDFTGYMVKFHGTRKDYDPHVGSYIVTDVTGIDNVRHAIKAEFDYDVSVIVQTKTGDSASSSTAKLEGGSSGSGVPPEVDGITPIVPPNDESVMSFSPKAFSDEYGEVKYFAILLSANYDFDQVFGYWDGKTWPEVGQYTNGLARVIEPYQITEKEWDPRKVTTQRADDDITFTLGDSSCEDLQELCNGPLRADTKYTITVRGFTNGGYRDIRVAFDTQSVGKAISLGVILGITFGVIFTGLIFLGSYLLYRKRIYRNKNFKRTSMIDRMNSRNAPISDRYDMYN